MKVCVTGGHGFIGSHLVDSFINRGDSVLVIDNHTGASVYLNERGESGLYDFSSEDSFNLIEKFQPELICHAGASIDVRKSVEDPVFDFKNNGLNSAIFFDRTMRFDSVRHVLFLSSGGTVYGEVPGIPADEKVFLNPESPYGISKMFGEFALRFFAEKYEKGWAVLRLSNVFGPRQSPKGEAGVVSIFTEAMLDNRPITIYGDGSQIRDYVFVHDVVSAALALEFVKEGVFNVSTGIGTSVYGVFQALANLTGYSKKPTYAPPRKELYRSCLSSEKLRRLGWQPEMDFDKGIQTVVDWLKTCESKTAIR